MVESPLARIASSNTSRVAFEDVILWRFSSSVSLPGKMWHIRSEILGLAGTLSSGSHATGVSLEWRAGHQSMSHQHTFILGPGHQDSGNDKTIEKLVTLLISHDPSQREEGRERVRGPREKRDSEGEGEGVDSLERSRVSRTRPMGLSCRRAELAPHVRR